jgi:hypothetical protein
VFVPPVFAAVFLATVAVAVFVAVFVVARVIARLRGCENACLAGSTYSRHGGGSEENQPNGGV